MSCIDWPANRLADAAAKTAAASVRVNASSHICYERNITAYERALCELAAVTVAANRHEVDVTTAEGSVARVVKRDSMPAPRYKRRRRADAAPQDVVKCVQPCPEPPTVAPVIRFDVTCSVAKRTSTLLVETSAAKRRRMDRDHTSICEHRATAVWRDRFAALELRPVSSIHGAAADRLANLHTRVVSKGLAEVAHR